MLILVEVAGPEVDPREPMGSALRKPTYVWIEHTAVISIQPGEGKYKVLLGNGLTMPCKGDGNSLARRVNNAHKAYMHNPELCLEVAANDS